jgi:hypothetical protein
MSSDDDVSQAVSWTDIERASNISPFETKIRLLWIKAYLGYVPTYDIYLPHLPFIHVLVDKVEKGLMEPDVFVDELLFQVKQMRNADMKKFGWVSKKEFTEEDYAYYDSYLADYKQAARERLCKLLTYEPKLEYSLYAEIYLRELFIEDRFYNDMPFCDMDYKAATIAHYRETYLRFGEKAADQCDIPKAQLEFIEIMNEDILNGRESS